MGDTSGEKQNRVRGLLSQGYSIFPVASGTKKPLVAEWKPYQATLPPEKLVNAWLRAWPFCSWAIVCGSVSSLCVLDVDPRHGGDRTMAEYPTIPPTVVTGSGGHHIYLRVSDPIPSRNGWKPGVDIKGVGGFVIAPDSVHESGKPYRWVGEPLNEIPDWLRPILPSGAASNHLSPVLPFPNRVDAPGVLRHLKGVQKTAHGWKACCPAHDDRDPSLSVWVQPDGTVGAKCWAGCPYPVVREWIESLSLASTKTTKGRV